MAGLLFRASASLFKERIFFEVAIQRLLPLLNVYIYRNLYNQLIKVVSGDCAPII